MWLQSGSKSLSRWLVRHCLLHRQKKASSGTHVVALTWQCFYPACTTSLLDTRQHSWATCSWQGRYDCSRCAGQTQAAPVWTPRTSQPCNIHTNIKPGLRTDSIQPQYELEGRVLQRLQGLVLQVQCQQVASEPCCHGSWKTKPPGS